MICENFFPLNLQRLLECAYMYKVNCRITYVIFSLAVIRPNSLFMNLSSNNLAVTEWIFSTIFLEE